MKIRNRGLVYDHYSQMVDRRGLDWLPGGCALRAAKAVAPHLADREIFDVFHDYAGYPAGKGGGVGNVNAPKAIEKLAGVKVVDHVAPFWNGKKVTLGRFARENAGLWYVLVRGHALAVEDGKILDGGGRPRIRRIVCEAWKIENVKGNDLVELMGGNANGDLVDRMAA